MRRTAARIRPWHVVLRFLLVLLAWMTMGCQPRIDTPLSETTDGVTGLAEQREKFCSACHKLPEPAILPKQVWPAKILQMYDFAENGPRWERTAIPPKDSVIRYFVDAAPERLHVPPRAELDQSPVRFRKFDVHCGGLKGVPGIAGITVGKLRENHPGMVVCDMFYGDVWHVEFPPSPAPVAPLTQLSNPCRSQVVDVDKDGLMDVVVADLGSFYPSDEPNGTVYWLKQEKGGHFHPRPLLQHVGRVADLRAGDFDADGRTDFVVAVFGWRKIGQITLLQNIAAPGQEPEFEPSTVEGKTGAVALDVLDADGDGDPDFVALLSQQHESVVLFLNDGRGQFRSKILYQAPHPGWGFSGMKAVDLDADGDLDLMLANGDSFDTEAKLIKPYHGISWLENTGGLTYQYHRIADLPAVHGVDAADLDGDGDIDLVAGVFMSEAVEETDTLLWYEQTGSGQFTPHVLETEFPSRAVVTLVDYDGDGDLDILAGNFIAQSDLAATDAWLHVWLNEGQ